VRPGCVFTMISKPPNEIRFDDIERLLEIGRSEDRTIEYKLRTPGSQESDKLKLLLKPVCSFANTDGGDLVVGVTEEGGTLKEIVGLDLTDFDQLQLTLEQMIQFGIEPQLRGINFQFVPLPNGRMVLVIRTPKSWTPPHRVKSNGRFYGRSSAGCFELDITQIRQAFLLSETTAERIRQFHNDRIANLLTGSRTKLLVGEKVALHVIPLSGFASNKWLPVSAYILMKDRLRPARSTDWRTSLNLEGMLVVAGLGEDGSATAYTQFFREGIIENVRAYGSKEDGGLTIPSKSYEQELLQNFQTAINCLKDLNFQPPAFVFLTIISAKGWKLGLSVQRQVENGSAIPFDRDVISIPGTELESFEADQVEIMKPLFDVVWNAAGFPSSINFDDQNAWIHQ